MSGRRAKRGRREIRLQVRVDGVGDPSEVDARWLDYYLKAYSRHYPARWVRRQLQRRLRPIEASA
jgi:hypothetical protein